MTIAAPVSDLPQDTAKLTANETVDHILARAAQTRTGINA